MNSTPLPEPSDTQEKEEDPWEAEMLAKIKKDREKMQIALNLPRDAVLTVDDLEMLLPIHRYMLDPLEAKAQAERRKDREMRKGRDNREDRERMEAALNMTPEEVLAIDDMETLLPLHPYIRREYARRKEVLEEFD